MTRVVLVMSIVVLYHFALVALMAPCLSGSAMVVGVAVLALVELGFS